MRRCGCCGLQIEILGLNDARNINVPFCTQMHLPSLSNPCSALRTLGSPTFLCHRCVCSASRDVWRAVRLLRHHRLPDRASGAPLSFCIHVLPSSGCASPACCISVFCSIPNCPSGADDDGAFSVQAVVHLISRSTEVPSVCTRPFAMCLAVSLERGSACCGAVSLAVACCCLLGLCSPASIFSQSLAGCPRAHLVCLVCVCVCLFSLCRRRGTGPSCPSCPSSSTA